MTKRSGFVLAIGALVALSGIAFSGAAQAQQNIDYGSQGYFGGVPTFGGYYNTFGGNGGFGGNSGYGTYRRVDEGRGSTTNTTGTIASFAFPGGAEPSKHCAWLHERMEATHKKIWRERYAACRRDYQLD